MTAITLVPSTAKHWNDAPVWDVFVDGVLVGHVEKGTATREDRTPGRVYVNSRWEVTAWYAAQPGRMAEYRYDHKTRVDAVADLLGYDFVGDRYAAARAAKVVRATVTPAPATDAADTALCPVCDTTKPVRQFPTKSGQPGVRDLRKCRACR